MPYKLLTNVEALIIIIYTHASQVCQYQSKDHFAKAFVQKHQFQHYSLQRRPAPPGGRAGPLQPGRRPRWPPLCGGRRRFRRPGGRPVAPCALT